MPVGGDKLRQLLHVGRALVAELDPELVLARTLEEARAVTGARYAAIGVLNEPRTELHRFVTDGIDRATERAIGDRPRGRGVLGLLIADPRPLRLPDVGRHPYSYGFPAGHPAMGSFLGVPIMIGGEAWGNLYLAEKEDADGFTNEDEEAVVILAEFAATAIDNARRYEHSERRRQELESAVRGLEAGCDIADAVGDGVEPARVLELIVKRGRALLDARSVVALIGAKDGLVVAAAAGDPVGADDQQLALAKSIAREVLEHRGPQRRSDRSPPLGVRADELVAPVVLAPMIHRDAVLGVLAACGREGQGRPFTGADEQLLCRFAASAGDVLAIARAVHGGHKRSADRVLDEDRRLRCR